MKLFQSDIEEIQRRTRKEYLYRENVQASNNAESEYVTIYDDDLVEETIVQTFK